MLSKDFKGDNLLIFFSHKLSSPFKSLGKRILETQYISMSVLNIDIKTILYYLLNVYSLKGIIGKL